MKKTIDIYEVWSDELLENLTEEEAAAWYSSIPAERGGAF